MPGCRMWATGQPVGPPMGGGHTRRVRFSPDGRFLLAGGTDGVVRLWNTTHCQREGPEMRHGGADVYAIFSPDQRLIASFGTDGNARVWDSASGRAIIPPIRHEGIRTLAFSPDGKILLTGSPRGPARLWNSATGQAVGVPLNPGSGVTCASFSPDGRIVVTGGLDHTARLWDVATAQQLGSPMRHRMTVGSAQFSPDAESLLTSSDDGTAKIWDLAAAAPMLLGPFPEDSATAHERPPMHHAGGVRFAGAVVSPDRTKILLRNESEGSVRMVAAADGHPVGLPIKHRWTYIGAAAFHPDGECFATSSYDRTDNQFSSTSSICQIFSTSTGRPITPALPHDNWPAALAFRPDGKVLVTGDYRGLVHLWDVQTGQPIGAPFSAGSIVMSLAISRDGKMLAAGTAERENQVVLWDLETLRRRGNPTHFKAIGQTRGLQSRWLPTGRGCRRHHGTINRRGNR